MPFDAMTADITLSAPPTEVLLPHVPSQLLRLALADLRKVEAMPERYRVDMLEFHSFEAERCSVCFAGAVMAQHLGANHEVRCNTEDFGKHNDAALMFLSDCAVGNSFEEHLLRINHIAVRPINRPEAHVIYARDPAGFHAAMHALADAFAASGQ